ncbi:MAG: adenylate kinase [Oscillospiraceae bacterium]|nr:adenylate kinase [Oscillospiraceae bacterium]
MNIVITGAPGSGKGSRTPIIEKMFNIPTISTGNMLRAEVEKGTELGLAAKGIMDSGGLVSDEIIIGMLATRIKESDCRTGFILDGVPRTIVQAEMMKAAGIKIDKLIVVEVPNEVIVARLSGRRVCSACSEPYHVEDKKPIQEGICDKDGGELVTRKDDKPEVIKSRLETYHSETKPIIDFYKDEASVSYIDANRPFGEAEKAVREAFAPKSKEMIK